VPGEGDPSSLEMAKRIGLDGIQVSMGERPTACTSAGRGPEGLPGEGPRAASRAGLAGDRRAEQRAPRRRARARIWLLDSLEAARGLGVQLILVAMFFRGEVKPSDGGRHAPPRRSPPGSGPAGEKAGLVLALENYHSAEDNLRIVEKVGSPALQVYYDVGNSTTRATTSRRRSACWAKRAAWANCTPRTGPTSSARRLRIDFRKVREALDDSGWSGWIHIEGAAPNGLAADYAADLRYLRAIFPARSDRILEMEDRVLRPAAAGLPDR